MSQLPTPVPMFFDSAGAPLDDGYVYVGTSGLDPITNPVTVYSDSALTTTVTQPIRTSGGYPTVQGAAIRLFTTQTTVSVTTRTKGGTNVLTQATVSNLGTAAQILIYSTRTAIKALIATAGDTVYLTESGREGAFVFDSSDLSASVTADAQEGIYVPPDSDATGASGAWVREYDGSFEANWFGATGDGTTDDTTALNAALDLAVYKGASLHLPAGTYRTTGQLEIDTASAITVFGDGYNTVIKPDAAGTYIIFYIHRTGFTALNGLRLDNFRIDANAAGQLDTGVVTLNNVVGAVISRLWISGATRVSGSSGQNGISISAGSTGGTGPELVVRDCYFDGCSKAAINFTSEAVNGLIEGNIIKNGTGNGTTPGIQVNGGFNGKIVGNDITACQGPGIYLATDGLSNDPRNTVIANNNVHACGATSTTQGDGIRVTSTGASVGRIVISGNQCYDNGTSTNGGNGIYVINNDNVVITGNLCRNNQWDGIRVQACNHVHVEGNISTGNNAAGASYTGGITVRGTCSHISIIGNHFSDDKSTKTQSYGILTESGATLTYLTIAENHTEGNSLGPMLLSAGATPMYIEATIEKQTTSGSVSTWFYFDIPDNTGTLCRVSAVGTKSDGSDRAIYSREGLFYRNGGTATQQGATTTLGTDIESNASWGGVTLGVSSNLVVVYAQGLSTTTINWRGKLLVETI